MKAHSGEAMDYANNKFGELRKLAEDGDGSWKYLGFTAGCAIMFIGFTGFLGALFSFNIVGAILHAYFFAAGGLMAALEFKESFIPDVYRRKIRQEALFLYRPYGRAAFYFGVGLVLMSVGGFVALLCGLYTSAVGVYIYYGSVGAMKALNELRASSTDLNTIRAKFDSADKDSTGFLSPEELASCCAELGTTLKRHELESAIFILDKNEDGKISFEEFQAWWYV